MQTLFRQIPKTAPAAVPKEPAKGTVLRRPKFNLVAGFIVLILIGLAFAYFIPEDKSREEYFQELQNRKEAKQHLTTSEQSDFCELLFLLRDSVSTECVGILDGINWDNPPKSPEDLSEDWEETTEPSAPKTNRKFRHKIYGIEIQFDEGDPDAPPGAEKAHDHYHRINPNRTSKKDFYLTKKGTPIQKGHKNTHIRTRK